MPDLPVFGHWLRERRKARNLTQEDLAARLACSGSLIRKLEAGQRVASPQMADHLADLLGVSTGERAAFVQFAIGRLRGAAAQRQLWQTLHSHTAEPHPTNLLAPLTALIGRAAELQSLGDLLQQPQSRLVTLTGPPGIGKTRLALEAGISLLDHFADGVFFVALAPVTDPEAVPAAIARELGIQDPRNLPMADQVGQFLREKHLLLVLDNFEQVLDAAPLVVRWLTACPDLTVLVTSREALHVLGEQHFPVPALDTADPANLPPLEAMVGVPAITLFLERGQAVRPDFTLTGENAQAVAGICAHLEGLPLAIELASARVTLLSPQEILSRLQSADTGENLTLLRAGGPDLPARQRTLRNAIEWSYNLLSAGEKTLFARLGVFVPGCTLAAAQAVCNADGDLPLDVLEGLESLLDKNLLQRREGVAGETRYGMLGVLRSYALERLQASGRRPALSAQHARYYLNLAQTAAVHLDGLQELIWLARLDQAYENIRAAITWSIGYEPGAATALRFAEPLNSYWLRRGHVTDARNLLGAALARAEEVQAPEKARALGIAGRFAAMQGDATVGAALLSQSLDLYRDLGDRAGVSTVLRQIGMEYLGHRSGDSGPARQALEEALALARETGNAKEIGEALGFLGAFTQELGDRRAARTFFAEGLTLARRIEDRGLSGSILLSLGEIARLDGDLDRARAIYEECVALFEASGANLGRAHALVNLAQVALAEGDVAAARPLLAASFALFRPMGRKHGLYHCIAASGALALLEGDVPRGIKLFSVTQPAPDRQESALERVDQLELERYVALARAQASDAVWASSWAVGQNLTLAQAVALALAGA